MVAKAGPDAGPIEKLKAADPDGPDDGGISAIWKFLFIFTLSAFIGLMILLAMIQDRPAQWLAWGLVVVAIASFATFYSKASDHDVRMRSAIAAAVVLTYLTFFALAVFSPSLQQASGSYKEKQDKQLEPEAETETGAALAGLTAAVSDNPQNEGENEETEKRNDGDEADDTIPADLFGSFSWVTGLVIAFYFGGRSVERIFNKDSGGAQHQNQNAGG